ncbi:hypothetical protein VCRA2113O119_220028 [Vibrio crassostreae]|nr:hypothetical protein VCRA2113O119_220028 [Vibrio crassostreae]
MRALKIIIFEFSRLLSSVNVYISSVITQICRMTRKMSFFFHIKTPFHQAI